MFTTTLSDTNVTKGFYTIGKDTEDHFIPLENLWDEGTYFRDLKNDKKVFAARPPGYAPIYLPLFILTGPETARSLFSLLCFLLDVIGCVALYLVAAKITKSKAIASLAFALYLLLPFISVYSNYSKTEPISTSLIIISILMLIKGLDQKKLLWVLISGLLFADAILIRPALALFVPFYMGFVFMELKFSIKKSFVNLIILGFPVFILVSAWIIRSSVIENRFIPIIDPKSTATPETRALFNFISSTNGDIQSWIPESEAAWFAQEGSINFNKNFSQQNPFDPTTFNGAFNFDSLKVLRSLYWNTKRIGEDISKSDSLFIKKTETLLSLYKFERSWWHRIKTEVTIFWRFVFVRYTHGTILQKSTIWYQIGKIYWLLLYYIVILGGFAGIVFAVFKKETWAIFLGLFSLFYISIHANFLGMIENRYLAAIMPFFAVLGAYFAIQLDYLLFKGNIQHFFEKKFRA